MSNSTKSTVISQPKPINVFYVWYSELCRRLNSSPAPVVKPARTKCETVLDFVGDRLKVEEWSPVIKALRQDTSLHVITIRSRLGNCQFLHDIDTEEKARRMKRRYGTLWTAYVLKSLLKSLSYSIRNNQVLTCLELDGLPMFSQYLEPLLQALKKNKTIKCLSLTHCPIKDIGCQMVCGYLRFTPNVEIVNFSACSLSSESGTHLAKLIKYQQIDRYCESWHNSLRYEEPNVGLMRGIKRITLNDNPNFSDEGLSYILNELDDDLWIKALDFQKCGITENIVEKVLDVVEYNQSLEIIDLRHNEQLSLTSLEKIFTLLKQKQQFGYQPEFKWCNTMLTLPCASVQGTVSSYSVVGNSLQKSKSAPLKNEVSIKASNLMVNKDIRRSKTEHQFIKKGNNKPQPNLSNIEDEKKKVVKLNSQLNEEIAKRKEIEKQNHELKMKLEQIQSVTDLQKQLTTKDNVNKIISVLENFRSNQNGIIQHVNEPKTKNANNKKPGKCEVTGKNHTSKTLNGFHKDFFDSSMKNGMHGVVKGNMKNGYKNGDCLKLQNGFVHVREQASQIFENLLMRNKTVEDYSDQEEDNLIDYYLQGQKRNGSHEVKEEYVNGSNGANDMTGSQVSLYNFIEELKGNNSRLTVNIKKLPHKSKLSITEKDGGT